MRKECTELFKEINVGDKFSIPSGANHEPENFVKLQHNKAQSLSDKRIVNFVDDATIWAFSFNADVL
jgi:hypothetical protein